MNTRLLVLAMLAYKPMHGYEIIKFTEERRTDLWADVLPGSIYHALKAMEKDGLVAIQANEQTGHRMRSVYAITEVGREALKRLAMEQFQRLPRSFPASLYVATNAIPSLPAEELVVEMDKLAHRVAQEIEIWRLGEKWYEENHLDNPFLRAAFVNGYAHMEADRAYLLQIAAILKGDIDEKQD